MKRHRSRTTGWILSLAALALPLAAAAPALADDGPLPPDTYCGSDYFFTVKGPDGWEKKQFFANEMASVRFQPHSLLFDPGVEIIVTTPEGSRSHESADLDETLRTWVILTVFSESVDEVHDFQISHPHYATRSAELSEGRGRVVMTAIDPGSPRHVPFIVYLRTRHRAPTDADMKRYQGVIDSLREDPARRCAFRADGTVGVIETPSPPTPRVEPAAAPLSTAFDLKKAESGCAMLSTLVVPIYCTRAPVKGEDAFLVLFQKGRQPAHKAFEQLSRYVEVPFCWAARGHANAPHLLMGASDLDVLREYDCDKRAFTRTIHPPDQGASAP